MVVKRYAASFLAISTVITGCATSSAETTGAAGGDGPPKAQSPAHVLLRESCPVEEKDAESTLTSPFVAILLPVVAPLVIEGVKAGAEYLVSASISWLNERARKYSAVSRAVLDDGEFLYKFRSYDGQNVLVPSVGCIIFYRGERMQEPWLSSTGREEKIELYAEFKLETQDKVEWQPFADKTTKIDLPVTMRLLPLKLEYLKVGTELGTDEAKDISFELKIERRAGLSEAATIASVHFDFGKLIAGTPEAIVLDSAGILPASNAFVVPGPSITEVDLPQWTSPGSSEVQEYKAPVVDGVPLAVSVDAYEMGNGGHVERFLARQAEAHKEEGLKAFGDWLDEMYKKWQGASGQP